MGDKTYGGVDTQYGMCLASVSITLDHPATNEAVTFAIDEPLRFGELRETEQRAWEIENGEKDA